MCFQFLDGIIDQVNNYTIIYSGITGEGFWSSARSATKVFRRNLVTGLLSGALLHANIFHQYVCLFCKCDDLDINCHCLHFLMHRPDYEASPLHRFLHGRSDLGLWYFHIRDTLTELTLWLYRGHCGYDRAVLCVAVLYIHYDEHVSYICNSLCFLLV